MQFIECFQAIAYIISHSRVSKMIINLTMILFALLYHFSHIDRNSTGEAAIYW